MKKILSVVLCAALLAACFAGCGANSAKNDKLHIITAIYPEYEWVRQIVGDAENVELSLLLDKGVDIHSFEPTAKDIVDISSADMFIYNGGESDKWADDVVRNAQNKELTAVNLMDELGGAAKEEAVVEGMQTEEEADGGDGEKEYDEHIWLSLRNAAALSRRICAKLAEKDPAHKAAYEANTEAYVAQLDAMDAQYTAAVGKAKNDTLIFADRFPFRYLTDDYGLHYYAAFSGCSAESEASFQTLVFLADKLDSLHLNKLMVIDGSDQKIAKAVIDTAKTKDVKVLTLDSMQSSAASGETYLGIMEKNLAVLTDALN